MGRREACAAICAKPHIACSASRRPLQAWVSRHLDLGPQSWAKLEVSCVLTFVREEERHSGLSLLKKTSFLVGDHPVRAAEDFLSRGIALLTPHFSSMRWTPVKPPSTCGPPLASHKLRVEHAHVRRARGPRLHECQKACAAICAKPHIACSVFCHSCKRGPRDAANSFGGARGAAKRARDVAHAIVRLAIRSILGSIAFDSCGHHGCSADCP